MMFNFHIEDNLHIQDNLHILEKFHILDFDMNFYKFFTRTSVSWKFPYPGKYPYHIIFLCPVKASVRKSGW